VQTDRKFLGLACSCRGESESSSENCYSRLVRTLARCWPLRCFQSRLIGLKS
jgi:hypothetical protein